MNKEERIEYLEEERKRIWERLTELEEKLDKKTSDYEIEARVASEQSKLSKDATDEAKSAVFERLEEVNQLTQNLREDYENFNGMFLQIKANAASSSQNNDLIGTIYNNIITDSEKVEEQIIEIQKILDGKALLDERMLRLEDIFKKGEDYDSKLSSLYKIIGDRRKEIDDLYYRIIGYTDKDDEGEETIVKGLKDELEESFQNLRTNILTSEENLKSLSETTNKSYERFAKEKQDSFSNLTTNWKEEYNKVLTKIENLLPNALTTGLSYAYSEKKQTEEAENKKHRTSFNIAIIGLVGISLIPFIISLVSLFQGTSLEEVITRVPRIVLAILPLYFPVLWVAYSANRKMNLAKRLIEEYSHKEVLSKTFEGLSRQIYTIDDKDISSELRIKLLYNILEVNSENPGKLISDYNKSDHPMMDALEKSVKLTNAITKLSKIPGFSKLASTLEQKSQDILRKEGEKAVAALESVKQV